MQWPRDKEQAIQFKENTIDITQHTILMPSNMMNKIYEMCYHTASLQA
jgi:hypothetical protein